MSYKQEIIDTDLNDGVDSSPCNVEEENEKRKHNNIIEVNISRISSSTTNLSDTRHIVTTT